MSVDATISTWKLSKLQVTATEKLFLLSCADRAGEEGICWPSIKRLCADTCLDRKTIIKIRQSCIDKGLLVYTGEKKGRTKSVEVMRLTYVSSRIDEDLSSPKNGTGSSPKNGTTKQSQNWDTESKRGNLKEETNTIPDSCKSGKKKSVKRYENDERFMRFYSAYPKKRDPHDAFKAFRSIVGNDDELLEHIITDLETRKKKHTQWQDKQFIKYPAVYLRKGEYLSEIENTHEEQEEKERIKREADKKLRAEQERISRERNEYELKKQQQIQEDGKAYREVAGKSFSKPSKTFKERLGWRK